VRRNEADHAAPAGGERPAVASTAPGKSCGCSADAATVGAGTLPLQLTPAGGKKYATWPPPRLSDRLTALALVERLPIVAGLTGFVTTVDRPQPGLDSLPGHTLARVAGADSRRVVYVAAAVINATTALALSEPPPPMMGGLISAVGIALPQRAGDGALTAGAVLVSGLDPAATSHASALVIANIPSAGGAVGPPPVHGGDRRKAGVELRARRHEPRAGRCFVSAGLLSQLNHERVIDQALELWAILVDPKINRSSCRDAVCLQ
jgi:hypothetical protein